jgi:TetR/AcrR family transcriptional regulator, regulator of biofilm formation and stress response
MATSASSRPRPARTGRARPLRTRRASPARQARGERRRQELLDAVLRLVAREGVAAITHRAVAREAGVTHRLTTYYFETKEQMLREAFRHLSARSLERTEQAARDVASARGGGRALDAAIDAVADAVLGGLRGEARAAAEFSLVLEIPRQPGLAAGYAAWQQRMEEILCEHARALGSDDPEADARIIVAMLRGLQLERLAKPAEPPSRAALRALLARILTRL